MNTVRLSVAIMTHSSRKHLIEPLLNKLKESGSFPIGVIIDEKDNDIWKTAKRAWLSPLPSATHHLVLQDDVLVCKDLLASLPEIIKHIPPMDSISLCSNHQASQYLERQGLNWLRTDSVRHGQALIQPVSQIRDWVAWCDWNVRPDYRLDDGRLEMYLKVHSRWIWNTIPSLVEHNNKGTVGNDIDVPIKNQHNAYKFIGEDNSPLSIDWSLGITLPFTKQENMRGIEKWAIGKAYNSLGRNQINKHAVPNRISMLMSYDMIMKKHRSQN